MEPAVSLPYAVELIKKQTPETMQFCSRNTCELISFKEKFFEIAENWGEISAYRAYSEKHTKKIMEALDVINNRDAYLPLPRAESVDLRKIMLDFAELQQDTVVSKKLKAALTALFGNKYKRFSDALERFELTDKWEQFATNAYIEILRAWCVDNNLPCTDEYIAPPDNDEDLDDTLPDDDEDEENADISADVDDYEDNDSENEDESDETDDDSDESDDSDDDDDE